jgi:hypothetical protein
VARNKKREPERQIEMQSAIKELTQLAGVVLRLEG